MSFTNQKSLIHLNEQHLNKQWQQKVFAKLLELQYASFTGKALIIMWWMPYLTMGAHDPELLAVPAPFPSSWVVDVLQSYSTDPMAVYARTKGSCPRHSESVVVVMRCYSWRRDMRLMMIDGRMDGMIF